MHPSLMESGTWCQWDSLTFSLTVRITQLILLARSRDAWRNVSFLPGRYPWPSHTFWSYMLPPSIPYVIIYRELSSGKISKFEGVTIFETIPWSLVASLHEQTNKQTSYKYLQEKQPKPLITKDASVLSEALPCFPVRPRFHQGISFLRPTGLLWWRRR